MTPKGVAVVKMDVIGAKQNTLSEEFNKDVAAMIGQVEQDDSIKAVVVMSGKPGSWIAGADVKMIEGFTTVEEAADKSAEGQEIMDRIAGMQKKKPWIAAIDGACLGGGLETAMAMSHRIATKSSKTVLGVPEVMLGLLPGAGGTQRLPKIVGAANALDLMLTGKRCSWPTRQRAPLPLTPAPDAYRPWQARCSSPTGRRRWASSTPSSTLPRSSARRSRRRRA